VHYTDIVIFVLEHYTKCDWCRGHHWKFYSRCL